MTADEIYRKKFEEIKKCVISDLGSKDPTGEDLYVYFHPLHNLFALALFGRAYRENQIKEIYNACFYGEYPSACLHSVSMADAEPDEIGRRIATIAIVQHPKSSCGPLLVRWDDVAGRIKSRCGKGYELTTDSFAVLPLCPYKVNAEANTDKPPEFIFANFLRGDDTLFEKYRDEPDLPGDVCNYIEYLQPCGENERFKDAVAIIQSDDTTTVYPSSGTARDQNFIKEILRFFKDTKGLWRDKDRPKKESELLQILHSAGRQETISGGGDGKEKKAPLPIDIAEEVIGAIPDPGLDCEAKTAEPGAKGFAAKKKNRRNEICSLRSINVDHNFFYSLMR